MIILLIYKTNNDRVYVKSTAFLIFHVPTANQYFQLLIYDIKRIRIRIVHYKIHTYYNLVSVRWLVNKTVFI